MSWNLRLAADIWRRGGRRLRNRFRLKRLEPARGPLQLEYLEERTLLAAGAWSTLTNSAPSSIGTMLLLTDGSVMAQGAGQSSQSGADDGRQRERR